MVGMLVVRATKRLLQRLGRPTLGDGEQSTTLLGQWYATALRWRPQVALLVNEATLLPVLIPLAPAATLLARTPEQIARVLAGHGVPDQIIDAELEHMRQGRVAATANRSVVGVMNEFTFLADAYRRDHPDLIDLAVRLAATPCGPLYSTYVSPRPCPRRPPQGRRTLTRNRIHPPSGGTGRAASSQQEAAVGLCNG
jgi:hypothetical protein